MAEDRTNSSSVLAAIANPATVNPLAALSEGTQVARQIYGLRHQQADEALGQAYAGAVDPQTGRFDPLKFNMLAAQNPATAMAIKGGIESGQTLQGQQWNLNAAQLGAFQTQLAAALKLPDDQLHNGVVEASQRLIAAGFPADRVMSQLRTLDGQNPANLRTQLETMWRGTLTPDQQREATYGQTGTYTTPSGALGGYTAQTSGRGAGTVTPGAGPGAPQGMSPGERGQVVEWTDNRKTLPDGSPNPTYGQRFPITKGELTDMLTPPQPGSIPGNGRVPPALLNNNKPQPGTTAQPAGPQPKPGTMQPSTADAANIAASGPKFQGEIEAGTAQQPLQATLSTMQSDIGRFSAGTSAGKTLDWKRAAQSWAPSMAKFLGIKPDEIASQESFQKAAAMIVAQQQAHSDKSMDVIMAATPHDTLSPDGVDSIIRQLQGNSDYLQARAKIAQAFPNRTDFGGYQAKVADLDPRFFQYERLTPQQKADYFEGLRKAGQSDAFKAAYAKTKALVGGGS
jgi:hypothetical protein